MGNREAAHGSVKAGVFYPAAVIVLAFVAFAMLQPGAAFRWMSSIHAQLVGGLGWYYVLIVTAFVAFAIWLGVGHHGDVKLGPDDEEPEFGTGSWFAMLFGAGMGIGLVFWGVAEPLHHFAGIPNRASGVGGDSMTAARESLVQTFVHWGLHPWAIYVVVGLAVAHAVHRRRRPMSIRWTLEPLLGGRVKGWAGDAIDVIAIVSTIFGVATSLGLGVSQIAAGLSFLDLLSSPGTTAKVVLIGLITLVAVGSVVTGVGKGIRWLSNLNIGLAGAMLLFVAIAGPTVFLVRNLVQTVGLYLRDMLQLSLSTTALSGDAGVEWQSWWTIFYWGWWISWAPFVGVFIARISRGRTVREFVGGVLLVPTSATFLWFTVFGGSALATQLERGVDAFTGGLIGADGSVSQEGSLFNLLAGLPAGTVVVAVAIVLVTIFFVTSSDSGSYVVDVLASGGDPSPPVWSRVFWSVLEGAVAAALLWAGGDNALTALRFAAIIIALPFSLVMIGMCIATAKTFRRERQLRLRMQRGMMRADIAVAIRHGLVEDGVLEPDGETGPADPPGSGRRWRR